MTTIKIEQSLHDHLLARPPLFHPEFGNPYIHRMLTEDPYVSESIGFDSENLEESSRGELIRLANDFETSKFYPISLREEITLNELVIYFSFGRIRLYLHDLDSTGHFRRTLEVINQRLELKPIPSDTTFSFPPTSKKFARELFTNFDDSSSVNMSFVEIPHEASKGERYESLLRPIEPAASTHYILKKRIQQSLTPDGFYSETWEADPLFDGMNYSSPNLRANLL